MKKVPVVILSGFLGSGKTTLLSKLLNFYEKKGVRPAIIMNEVGDVNLDGQLVNEDVPLREMLSGCICCTISGDLGMEIQKLVYESSPDLIIIEATGVANPIDIFEAVTEAALLIPIDIYAMITVLDAGHFQHWYRKGSGKTYHLMRDQIRCASVLLLNKSDLIHISDLNELRKIVESINPNALLYDTVHCQIDFSVLDTVFLEDTFPITLEESYQENTHQQSVCNHSHHDQHSQNAAHVHHHSYDHVMVYTHYFQHYIDRSGFEQIIRELPESVYRAKGIFTEAGTGQRMMFQFAYRQLELIPINPQGMVQDVAVFIGEQFPKNELKGLLEQCVTCSAK